MARNNRLSAGEKQDSHRPALLPASLSGAVRKSVHSAGRANRTVVEPKWSAGVFIGSSLRRAPQSRVILLGEGKRPCPTRITSASIALMTILKNLRSLTTSDHRAQPKNVCVANKWCACCHKISCAQHAHNLLNMERHQTQLGPSLIIGELDDRSKVLRRKCHTSLRELILNPPTHSPPIST